MVMIKRQLVQRLEDGNYEVSMDIDEGLYGTFATVVATAPSIAQAVDYCYSLIEDFLNE